MKKYIFVLRYLDRHSNHCLDVEISTMANSYPTAFYRAVAVAMDETTTSRHLQLLSISFKCWG